MSRALVKAAPVQLDTEQVKFIANTEFVPKAYRGNLPAIMACIATGRELGLGDMESLRHIHVVDGKPGLSAELMVKLARRAGHSIKGRSTAAEANVTGTRADNGDTVTVTFTIDEAKQAGLLNRANWKSYPADMLWARAVSRLCRRLFPDVVAGAGYTADELEPTDQQIVEGAVTDLALPEDSPSGPPQTATGGTGEEEGGEPQAAPSSPPPDEPLFPIPESAQGPH